YSSFVFEASKTNEEYFLGPIVLVRDEEQEYYEIVDGQQRLATLSLLFRVLLDLYADKLEQIKKNEVKNFIQDSIQSRDRLRFETFPEKQYQFVESMKTNYADLKQKLQDRKIVRKVKSEIRNNLFIQNSLILCSKVEESLDNNKINDFVNFLLKKVYVIHIVAKKLTSAVRIFETINTRGLDLEAADIIKAYLYRHLSENDLQRFRAEWHDIAENAKNFDETPTNCLTYHVNWKKKEKLSHALYKEFENLFPEPDVFNILADIKKVTEYIQYYREIEDDKSKGFIYPLWYLRDKVYWKSTLVGA
ncbi:unnamed protein product, partial [marine sediment metagenome]